MAKKRKNKRPIKTAVPESVVPNEPKGWNKPLTKKGKILFVVISVCTILIISIVSLYVIGNRRSKTQGFADIETMLSSYFLAINDNNKNIIGNFLYIQTPTYSDDVKTHKSYIDSMRKADVNIDIDSISIQEQDYSDLNALEDIIHLEPLTDAKICYVRFDETQTDEDNNLKYHLSNYCRIICYNVIDRWYMWSMTDLDASLSDITDLDGNAIDIEELLYPDTVTKIGNNYTGTIYVSGDWTANEIMPSESVKSAVSYTNGDTHISIAAYKSDQDANTLAGSVYDSVLTDDNCNETLLMAPTKLNDMDATFISYTDVETNKYSAIWVVKDESKDEFVHFITLDSTNANPALMKYYVSSFSM